MIPKYFLKACDAIGELEPTVSYKLYHETDFFLFKYCPVDNLDKSGVSKLLTTLHLLNSKGDEDFWNHKLASTSSQSRETI